MTHYLNRAYAQDTSVRVIEDLRIVDPEQPETDGKPGVCQIDHLVLHRSGCFIIESKSVSGKVVVSGEGSTGGEWTRVNGRYSEGMPSPIAQAKRQADFLRSFLQRHREPLLGRVPLGLRTVAKLMNGTDERGFRSFPIQLIVAISDKGSINRANGWKDPADHFQWYVTKADLVTEKIDAELKKHREARSLVGQSNGHYGLWTISEAELGAVAQFLLENRQPSAVQIQTTPPVPACKSCGGDSLTGLVGRYGPYWKCAGCGTNTTMPAVCSACGLTDKAKVRITPSGQSFLRHCAACHHAETLWTNP